MIYIKKIHIKDVIVFGIPLLITAIPLILVQCVQKGWIPEIDSFITIPKLLVYRTSEIKLDINNIFTIQFGLFCDYLGYNSIKGYGVLYYFGTFAMIIGVIITIVNGIKEIVLCIKKKDKKKYWKYRKEKSINVDLLMSIAFFSNLIIGFLMRINLNVLNGILISATFFELVTLRELYKKQKLVVGILIIVYIVSFIMFVKTYFTDFQNHYYSFHDNGAINLIRYLNVRFADKEIFMDGQHNTYIYSLYVNPISPHEFNEYKETNDSEVVGYKNFHSYWNDVLKEGSVYITLDEGKAKYIMENSDYLVEIYDGYYIMYDGKELK